jgi:hypothetical protein
MWIAFRSRVDALDRNLGGLVASSPKDQVGSLDRLRDAVTDLRSATDATPLQTPAIGRVSAPPGRLSDSSRRPSGRFSRLPHPVPYD